MALSKKLMIDGEREILTIRTHVKALWFSAIVLVVTCAVAGFVVAVLPDESWRGVARIVVVVLALAVVVRWAVLPFVRWMTSTYHVTNRRLMFQTGILNRTGRVVPLSRINHVTFDKGITDRILGCGTLVVYDASEQSGLLLPDVPKVEDVHRTLTQLVFDAHEGGHDEDNHPGGAGGRAQS